MENEGIETEEEIIVAENEEKIEETEKKSSKKSAKSISVEELKAILEDTRKEEKDKLYAEINSFKEKYKEKETEAEKIAGELEEYRLKNLTAEEQTALKLQLFEKENEAMKTRLQEIVDKSASEIRKLQLSLAKKDALAAYGEEIIPDLVFGDTLEEIEKNAEISHQKYLSIFEKGLGTKKSDDRKKKIGTGLTPGTMDENDQMTDIETALAGVSSSEELDKILPKLLREAGL